MSEKKQIGDFYERGDKEAHVEDTATGEGDKDPNAMYVERAKILADRMSTLLGDIPASPQDPDGVIAAFKKMEEAPALTLSGNNSAKDDDVAKYSGSISETFKGVQENTKNLTVPVPGIDVAILMGAPSLDEIGDADGGNVFVPFVQGMVQSMLSTDILLPTIKEMLEKYPVYLEQNDGIISAEDKERYQKHLQLFKIMENHLKTESAEDPPAVKREKFLITLDYMRQLRDFGQPPAEILADTGEDLKFDHPVAVSADGGAA